jgi:hypothetical protein
VAPALRQSPLVGLFLRQLLRAKDVRYGDEIKTTGSTGGLHSPYKGLLPD